MTLLDWLAQARDIRTEADWWQEIADLRKYGNSPLPDLPHDWPAFNDAIAALVIAGRVKRDGELVSYVPVEPKQDKLLF